MDKRKMEIGDSIDLSWGWSTILKVDGDSFTAKGNKYRYPITDKQSKWKWRQVNKTWGYWFFDMSFTTRKEVS